MEDLPFWAGLAAQYGGPILELGCGTGRVLLHLAKAGYPVTGLDRDAGMLAVLQSQLPGSAPQAMIFQADMACFCLAAQFGGIFLPCNTLSTLDEDTRQAAFERIAAHLLPGGVFAASLPNPTRLRRLPTAGEPEIEEVFPHPIDGEPVQVSSEWQRSATHFRLTWHYDHLMPDGRVERLSAEAIHTLLPPETYLEELASARLEVVETFGDFDRSAYRPASPYFIFLARRRD
jgi:SAM-dependent methyltransferase